MSNRRAWIAVADLEEAYTDNRLNLWVLPATGPLGTLPRVGRREPLRSVITDKGTYTVEGCNVWRGFTLVGRVFYRDGMWSPEYDDSHRLGLRFSKAEAVHALVNDYELPEADRSHDYEPEARQHDTGGPCAVCGQPRSFGLH